MRTIIFIIVFISLPFYAFGQGSPVDRLFDKYSGQDGYTSVFISKYMFSMFSNLETKDKDIDEILGKLTGIRILASDESNGSGVNFFTEIMKDLPAGEYQELMVIKEKDQDFKFLIRENNDGTISELLMVAGGVSNNVLISIQGNIDLNTISRLSKSMDIQGLDNLEKIENGEQ